MKAVQIIGDKSSPNIVVNRSVLKPAPKGSELLIEVHAAGVTYDEIGWPELYDDSTRIPGHEISGTITELGPNYSGNLKIGQEVYGFLQAKRGRGQAEYVLCSAEEVAPKPSTLSHAEISALPIPLLTAWEAIIDHAEVKPDTTVLVTGASGAVGRIFLQLVQHLVGVTTIALASSKNHDMLRQLGASKMVDYMDPDWEMQIRNVDVIFDAAGGDILAKSWDIVKETGTIVTIADPIPPWAFGEHEPEEAASHPKVKYKFFIVSPNGQRLEEATSIIDTGVIRALPIKSFPVEEAARAWSFAGQRYRDGKAVLEMTGTKKMSNH